MGKNLNKVLAMILAAFLLSGLAAGCGTAPASNTPSASSSSSASPSGGSSGKSELEPVTLRVFFGDTVAPDVPKVAAEVSKITQEKLNATIEFVMFGAGEFNEKIPLLIASNEQMDIGFDAGWIDYVGRSKNGAYYDIAPLLETVAPKLKETIPELLWEGAAVNGGIYGVPTYKELAEQWALYAEKDFLESKGIDPASIKSLTDAEVILKACKEEGRAGFMVTKTGSHMSLASLTEYDMIGGDRAGLAAVSKTEGQTVVNYFETENYKNFVYLMKDWYDKGYIAQDVVTRENYDEFTKNGNQRYGLGLVSYSPLNEVGQSKNYGKELIPMPVTPITTTNGSTTGSLNCIYAKSKNPERALQFLELWNTEPQVKNLITFGIEGVHYKLVDGKVEQVADISKIYFNQNWRTGNMFISYLLAGEPDDKYDQYLAFNEKAVASQTLGFQPDTAAIDDKMVACKAVITEYNDLLKLGVVNPDEILPKFIQALKDAGSDDIVGELQKQYTQWKTK